MAGKRVNYIRTADGIKITPTFPTFRKHLDITVLKIIF